MKQIANFLIKENRHLSPNYGELVVSVADGCAFPESAPGQFVQIQVPDSPTTFLRRPISVCDTADGGSTLHLLIRNAGEGTAHLLAMRPGLTLNIIGPLGRTFTTDIPQGSRVLLVGGGVGIAPMHFLGKHLAAKGVEVEFVLGARTKEMLLLRDRLCEFGKVNIATDDGSEGVKGVVTDHPALSSGGSYDMIYCCGPAPMMKAVAAVARKLNIPCEVSLENMMACGVGACLCCVEKTVRGNVCVCTEGPVFNINELTW